MPHTNAVAIGERGKTTYNLACPVCQKPVTISGYVLRDFEGYPLNRSAQRLDYLFPDGSSKQGVLCNKCNDNHRNKLPMVYDEKTKQWNWISE